MLKEHSAMSALTGFRGLAALWVLVYHAWVYAVPKELTFSLFGESFYGHVFLSLGWAGVQVFFVLSAFLLTLPFARAHAGLGEYPRTGEFLIKRVVRVFPAYYLQVGVLFSIAWLLNGDLPVPFSQLPGYALMLFVPEPIGLGTQEINGVWWTLPIEFSFYLLLPVIASCLRWRYTLWVLIGSLLCMLMWRFVMVAIVEAKPLYFSAQQVFGSMDSFGLGMVAALIHVQYVEKSAGGSRYRAVLWSLTLATPVLFFLLGQWMMRQHMNYWGPSLIFYTWSALFSVGVVVLVLQSTRKPDTWFNRVFGSPIFFYLGMVSYGVYLWHLPIMKWLLSTEFFASYAGYKFPPLLVASFILTLLFAALSWHLYERRVIDYSRRWLAKRR